MTSPLIKSQRGGGVGVGRRVRSLLLPVLAGNPLGLLVVRPEGPAHLHSAGRHAGEAAQAEPQALPPGTLLEVCRVGIQDGPKTRRSGAETDGPVLVCTVLTAVQRPWFWFWLHVQLEGHGRFVFVFHR